MKPKLLLTLLSAAPSQRERERGSAMLVAIFVVLTLVLGSVALANRSLGGKVAALFQGESREAREVADAGIATVITELNKPSNRRLLVTDLPMSSWSTSNNKLVSPCGTDLPTTTAVGYGSSSNAASLGGGSFTVVKIVVKNADRSSTFSQTPTSSTNTGSYNDSLINLGTTSGNPNVGYIAVTVKGTIRGSTAIVTREFQIVPKCCGLSFGSGQTAHGNDTRACGSASGSPGVSVLVGTRGGGILSNGASSAVLYQLNEAGTNTNGTAAANILCVVPSTTSTCGGTQGNNSVNGVPIRPINISMPPLPTYPCPGGTTCNTGFTINLTSSSDSTATGTSNQSATTQDYLRVNSSGQVEMCNAKLVDTAQTSSNSTVASPVTQFIAGSCSTNINNFCARIGDGSTLNPYAYHCRISNITAYDTTTSSINTSDATRVQNNTLWVDSSAAPIFLYMNSAWTTAGNINTNSGQIDGQIQHVYCSTVNYTVPCGTNATPSFQSRAAFYSDKATTMSIGDDGYIRDFFTYMPLGSVFLNNPSGAAVSPAYRGTLWVNNLAFNCSNSFSQNPPVCTGSSTSPSYLGIPAAGTTFATGTGPSVFAPLPNFDWVARSAAATKLFDTQ